MTGLVLNTGRKPSLAGRFQETGSKPQMWLMSFPVCNCASLNASVLDRREKQSYHFPTLHTFCCLRKDCLYSVLNGNSHWCLNL